MVAFGSAIGGTKVNRYSASDAAISYSDCVTPAIVNNRAQFVRPITDDFNLKYANPGTRVRFRSNAKVVNVLLYYSGFASYTGYPNLLGSVFIDGIFVQNFWSPQTHLVTADHRVNIVNATAADRLYEIIFPYEESVEFSAVEVDDPYVVTAAAARTGLILVPFGDSITQGFLASQVTKSWPYLLGIAKGWRVINMGYGSRLTVAADGTQVGTLPADRITVMIGHNDYGTQTPLATFKAAWKSLVTNIHTALPTVPIYAISLLWNAGSAPLTPANYRTQVSDAVSELGWSQLHYVDGLTLTTNAGTSFADSLHPNDIGAAEIASALAGVMT